MSGRVSTIRRDSGTPGGMQVPAKAWGHDRIVVAKTIASEEELAPAQVLPAPASSPQRAPPPRTTRVPSPTS